MEFLMLCLVLFSLDVTASQCRWPAELAGSTWRDSDKGDLVFTTTTMAGWPVRVVVDVTSGVEAQVANWACLAAATFLADGTLVMVTSTQVDPFQFNLYIYVCFKMTKVTDVSYRYYIYNRVERNANYDRIYANVANTITDLSVICQDSFAASGSEYRLMVKLDSLQSARIHCPYNFLGAYGYAHTAASGAETCDVTTSGWSLCADHAQMTFDLAQCATNVAYSQSDTVWCVDTVPLGGANYITVYNANDTDSDIDNVNFYRFACFAVSSDGTAASVNPGSCQKDQTPDAVPRDNSGADTGATLTMPTQLDACHSCPVLDVPTEATVSIETNGATTTATYTCSGGVVYGSSSRTCQLDDTWTSSDPSCFPPDEPTAAITSSNSAAIIGGIIGGLGFLIILGVILAVIVFMKLKKRPGSVKPEKRTEEAVVHERSTTTKSEKKLQAAEAKKKVQAAKRENKAHAKEMKKKEKERKDANKAQLNTEKKTMHDKLVEQKMPSMKAGTNNTIPTLDKNKTEVKAENGWQTPAPTRGQRLPSRSASLPDQHTTTNTTNRNTGSTVDALTTTTNTKTEQSQTPAATSTNVNHVENRKRPSSDDSRFNWRYRSISKATLTFENESGTNETVSMSKLSFTMKSVDLTSTSSSTGDVLFLTDRFFDHVHTRMEPCRHSGVLSHSAADLASQGVKDFTTNHNNVTTTNHTDVTTSRTTLKRKESGRRDTTLIHTHIKGNISYSHDDIVLNYKSPYATDNRQRSFIKRKKKREPTDLQEGLTYTKDDIALNYQSPYALSDRHKSIVRQQKMRKQRKRRLGKSREEWESDERRAMNEAVYQDWLRQKRPCHKYKAKF